MEKLTRTELRWIKNVLATAESADRAAIVNASDFEAALLNHHADQMKLVAGKLERIISSNSKRIEIK